jgi:hypothetical protein
MLQPKHRQRHSHRLPLRHGVADGPGIETVASSRDRVQCGFLRRINVCHIDDSAVGEDGIRMNEEGEVRLAPTDHPNKPKRGVPAWRGCLLVGAWSVPWSFVSLLFRNGGGIVNASDNFQSSRAWESTRHLEKSAQTLAVALLLLHALYLISGVPRCEVPSPLPPPARLRALDHSFKADAMQAYEFSVATTMETRERLAANAISVMTNAKVITNCPWIGQIVYALAATLTRGRATT